LRVELFNAIARRLKSNKNLSQTGEKIMFCPRCSQEQISEETKFCSRCGFSLVLISEILAHGGALPQLAKLYKSKKFFVRRNGLFFSLFWFLIFVLVLTPIFGILGVDELAAFTAVLGTMGGLILLIASFAFLKNEPRSATFANQELPDINPKNLSQANQTALPPQQTQPAQSYTPPANMWKAPNTGELIQPRSVTEGTTKLLKHDE
jgi:ribosomal protein S27AE